MKCEFCKKHMKAQLKEAAFEFCIKRLRDGFSDADAEVFKMILLVLLNEPEH